ncbi:hypothetical protein GQ600_25510 [Phytophthora cactorum]|nr:hypothetical protein GQ600_25510 [Phytophthora cactorum]
MFCHVDDVGFFADIAKGNVEYERGDNDKIYKVEPHVKKRKVSHDLQLQSVKHKINAPPSDKTSKAVTDDVIMEPESKEAGGAEQARKSITSTKKSGRMARCSCDSRPDNRRHSRATSKILGSRRVGVVYSLWLI